MREKEHSRAAQAQQRKHDAEIKKEVKNNFSKAIKEVKKADNAHVEKIVEIKTHLASLEMKSAQAEGALEKRHQQLTQIIEPVTQPNIQTEGQVVAGDLSDRQNSSRLCLVV